MIKNIYKGTRGEAMIKHIVMFQFTQEANQLGRDQIIQKLRESIENMNHQIPGLLLAKLYDNNLGGTHDIALYCEFEKPSDIEVFQNHPLHLAHKEMAKDFITNRVSLDFAE